MFLARDANTTTIIDAKDGDVVTYRAVNNIGVDEENTTINVLGNISKTTFYCI